MPVAAPDSVSVYYRPGSLPPPPQKQQELQQHPQKHHLQCEKSSPVRLKRCWSKIGTHAYAKFTAKLSAKRIRGKIYKSDLEKIGYTTGCPGCDAARTGRQQRGHSEECRGRVMRDMERLDMPGVS